VVLTTCLVLLGAPSLLDPLPAAADPQPPACSVAPEPPFAPVGAIKLATWRRGSPPALVHAPDCSDWTVWGSSLVVALTASFRMAGGIDAILARFASISAMRGIRYWSVTDRRWQTLISDASALSGPDAAKRRADFSVAELKSGSELYFAQADNRSSGRVVYRMQLRDVRSDRFVIDAENVTAVRLFLLPLFGAGDLHSLQIVQALSPGVLGYYSLNGLRQGATAMFGNDQASTINRANAIYRYIAGIPTDQEPPAAR
jgi:hypothetical protein